jgi:hypothetical protein
MKKPLFIALVLGLVTAGGTAMAQYPYPPPPPPAPGYAPRPVQQFGGPGTLAISSDLNLSFLGCSGCSSPLLASEGPEGNATNGSGWELTLAPAADYFVIQGLSIGGQIQYSHLHTSSSSSAGGGSSSSDADLFGIFARVGYNIPIMELLSWWPKVGIGFVDVSGSSGGVSGSANAFDFQIFAPLLLHLAPHFFAGLGPYLQTDLSASASEAGHSVASYPKQTTYGLMFTIGGWTVPAG